MYQDAGWSVRVFATQRDPYKGAVTPSTAVTSERRTTTRGSWMIWARR